MKYEVNNYTNIIFFTVDILFDYIFRNLAEQTNKNIICSLEDEKKLVKYKCILNIEEKLDIKKITVNYDFNFNVPYDLLVSPIASFTMDKIFNQT